MLSVLKIEKVTFAPFRPDYQPKLTPKNANKW